MATIANALVTLYQLPILPEETIADMFPLFLKRTADVMATACYSLMSRVVASPNSIVTANVNSNTYHQSPLMDKWESMLSV